MRFLLLALAAVSSYAQTRDQRIARLADSIKQQVIDCRRDLHMHPELSNREERTAQLVADKLRALGFDDVKTQVGKHGVVGLLKGAKPGGVVALRADMDALPITEENNVPYKSQNIGVKHACGHDGHTSIQLGVAEVLSKMRSDIQGTVKFIFQPAEEGAPFGEKGGAKYMIEQGVLENPRPSAIFGLHVGAQVPVGKVAYNSGALLASTDTFAITITGKTVHGAYPHEGIDGIQVAAQVIQALQTIRSRRIIASEPMVLTVGKIEGGTRNNILAGKVRMEGTLRTLNEGVREQTRTLMRQIGNGVAEANGAQFELEWLDDNPVTYNDPALTEQSLPSLARIFGTNNLLRTDPQMGGEDFAYYQKIIPGFFYFLGVGNVAKGLTAIQHTPMFDLDEDALGMGVKAEATLLLDYLDRIALKK